MTIRHAMLATAMWAATAAAGDRTPGPPPGDAPEPAFATARAAECAASLNLPWGPLASCRDVVVATSVASTVLLGFTAWWSNGLEARLSFEDEGWFGADTYSGGVDKLGHAFSFYVGTRLMTRAFGWAGVPTGESLALSSALALGLGLGIELFDGLARGDAYGFSWQDLAMDAVGTGLAWIAETRPGFDRWFAFRWRYTTAGDPQRTYDHHQYFAVLRLSGWSALGPDNPLRYLELMVGYGATGFPRDVAPGAPDERQRTVYAGVGLNLTELLDRSVFAGERRGGRTQWFATELLRYVQVPGTAATVEARTWQP